jgi:hypothetical protein
VYAAGVAGKLFGWAAAPCKPCPRNLITDGLTMLTNASVCINDNGCGYSSEGAFDIRFMTRNLHPAVQGLLRLKRSRGQYVAESHDPPADQQLS